MTWSSPAHKLPPPFGFAGTEDADAELEKRLQKYTGTKDWTKEKAAAAAGNVPASGKGEASALPALVMNSAATLLLISITNLSFVAGLLLMACLSFRAASSLVDPSADWGEEKVFFEGPPSRGDLATNLLLGATLLWLVSVWAPPPGHQSDCCAYIPWRPFHCSHPPPIAALDDRSHRTRCLGAIQGARISSFVPLRFHPLISMLTDLHGRRPADHG